MKRYFLCGALVVAVGISVMIWAKILYPVEIPISLDLQKYSMTSPKTPKPTDVTVHVHRPFPEKNKHSGAITALDVVNDPQGKMYGLHLEDGHDALTTGTTANTSHSSPIACTLSDVHASGLFGAHSLIAYTGRRGLSSGTGATTPLVSDSTDKEPSSSDNVPINDPSYDPMAPGDTPIVLDLTDNDNSAPAPVPEPGTMLLMGVGLAGLGFGARKKG